VTPHPDDEILGAGGLIRACAMAGRKVTVLSVTDGEAADPTQSDLTLRPPPSQRPNAGSAISATCKCVAQTSISPCLKVSPGHRLGHSADHVMDGDDVHEVLRSSLPLQWVKVERNKGFRIDCWMKP
jgi:hypothetical protein